MPNDQLPAAMLETLAALPNAPGVYRYYAADETVLYVGKARDLKKRVSSYFQKSVHDSPRIALMVQKIVRIEITLTQTETEALILENNLIKALNPRYNILFRDDKSYPFIQITHHPYARLAFYRGKLNPKDHCFGPYPNVYAVRTSIKILQKVFKIRTCEDSVFAHRSRPCLLYQIKRCSAPCVDLIAKEDYALDVHNAIRFLNGQHKSVINELQKRMYIFAEQMEFEKAAEVRDQITDLEAILEQQDMQTPGESDLDIIAIASQENHFCVNLAMIRNGCHLGDRAFFPKHIENVLEHSAESLEYAVLECFIVQHYLQHKPPSLIVLENELPDEISNALSEQQKTKFRFIQPRQGQKKRWLELAKQGAEFSLQQRLSSQSNQEQRVIDLLKLTELNEIDVSTLHIECFDISHSHGEATQASCVVFRNGAMQNSLYRRYKIAGITGGDDYAALLQAVKRRYAKTDENDLPHIVFIDGGKGQLQSAQTAFTELGIQPLCLIGVSKGEGRKVGLESLWFTEKTEPLQLGSSSAALMLIAQIRDEAHRFAISGMRAQRAKPRTRSSLEDIPGIGKKRRQLLITRLGGIAGVRAADVKQLQAAADLSPKLAQLVYDQLHAD